MSRLAVAEEILVVDPRLQALEVEPARGLVATIVIAIERHLVEARVVIGIPSMSGLPELVRAVVGVAVVSVLDLVSPVYGPLKKVVGIVVSEISAVVEERLSIGDGVVVARRGARGLDSKGCGP